MRIITVDGSKSIQSAIDAAQPGDVVELEPGNYSEALHFPRSGRVDARITLRSKIGRAATITGVPRGGPVISIRGKTHIDIRGLNLVGGRNGVSVDDSVSGDSRNIIVEGCYITQSRSCGIRFEDSGGVIVWGNRVEKTNINGIHEMISIIDTRGFVVAHNEVFNGGWKEFGVDIEGKEGIDIKDGSGNGIVENNYVHDLTRLGIYIDAWDELTDNIIVRNNRVERCKHGLAIASEAGGTVRGILVHDNIFTGNVKKGIIIPDWIEDGLRENIRIIKNTVTHNGDGGIAVSTTNITGYQEADNIVHSNGGR